MRLRTIWSIPGMRLLGEDGRLDRTADVIARAVARRLPKRLRYWSYIGESSRMLSNEIVPEVTYVTVLQRLPKRRNGAQR